MFPPLIAQASYGPEYATKNEVKKLAEIAISEPQGEYAAWDAQIRLFYENNSWNGGVFRPFRLYN